MQEQWSAAVYENGVLRPLNLVVTTSISNSGAEPTLIGSEDEETGSNDSRCVGLARDSFRAGPGIGLAVVQFVVAPKRILSALESDARLPPLYRSRVALLVYGFDPPAGKIAASVDSAAPLLPSLSSTC